MSHFSCESLDVLDNFRFALVDSVAYPPARQSPVHPISPERGGSKMLRCTGTVVRFESKPWSMEGRTGTTHTARVLVGDADFADVKVPEGVEHPRKGDTVDYGVVPGISGGKVSVTVRGNWQELVAEDVKPLRAAK